MTILQIEPQVKLGRILVNADKVVIGAYSYIRSGSELYGHCQIGRFCSIGQNVIIGLDKSKHPSNWLSTALFLEKYECEYIALTTPVTTTIKHDCWIGRDVVIMSGVTVGEGAIIGARAVVTADVPPYAVVAGVPAKILKYRFSADLVEKIESSQWWNYSITRISTLNMSKPEQCITEIAGFKTTDIARYPVIQLTRKGAKSL